MNSRAQQMLQKQRQQAMEIEMQEKRVGKYGNKIGKSGDYASNDFRAEQYSSNLYGGVTTTMPDRISRNSN